MDQQNMSQQSLEEIERAFESIFKGLPEDVQACTLNCIQCHEVCEQMVQYCLTKGGNHSEAHHIRLLQDCSEICVTAANFLVRGSEFSARVCEVCAEACSKCADDCEAMAGDDEMMKVCADACRRTADSCLRISAKH